MTMKNLLQKKGREAAALDASRHVLHAYLTCSTLGFPAELIEAMETLKSRLMDLESKVTVVLPTPFTPVQ